MSKSYGFIEITGVVAALDALDIMCKTADVELASWERKLGGRLVTIIIQGDVAAVTEAVEAAAAQCIKKPASHAVIARPHEEIVRIVELSASRWKKKVQAAAEKKNAGQEGFPEAAPQTSGGLEESAAKNPAGEVKKAKTSEKAGGKARAKSRTGSETTDKPVDET